MPLKKGACVGKWNLPHQVLPGTFLHYTTHTTAEEKEGGRGHIFQSETWAQGFSGKVTAECGKRGEPGLDSFLIISCGVEGGGGRWLYGKVSWTVDTALSVLCRAGVVMMEPDAYSAVQHQASQSSRRHKRGRNGKPTVSESKRLLHIIHCQGFAQCVVGVKKTNLSLFKSYPVFKLY